MNAALALSLPLWLDIAVAALLLIGSGFTLVGSFGLAKLSSFTRRLHGPSKATTLGVGCVLVASALWFAAQGEISGRELLVALFLVLTAPVSALLMAKAARSLDATIAPPPQPAPGQMTHAPDHSSDAARAAPAESRSPSH